MESENPESRTSNAVIVKTRIKDIAILDDRAFNVSTDFLELLDKKVISIVKECCRRARDNNRTTVMAKDL